MKIDRNLILAGVGLLSLGVLPALAQQVNPGSAAGPSSVTLNPGTALIGKTGIDQTAPGTTNKVSIGSDGTVAVPAIGVTTTNGSGSVTTGGTFQSALATSATRKGCSIQNQSSTEPLYVYLGTGTATTANSFALGTNGTFTCALSGAYVATDAIQVTAATSGHAYVLTSQ